MLGLMAYCCTNRSSRHLIFLRLRTHSVFLFTSFFPPPRSSLDRSSIIAATSSVRCVSYCNLLKISGKTLLRMASPDLLGVLKVRRLVGVKFDVRLNIN